MRKNKARPLAQRARFQVDKAVIAKVIVVGIIVSLACAVYRHLNRSPMFGITEVIVRQDGTVTQDKGTFVYLKGQNVFALDLDREAKKIASSFPSYQKIRLARFFPNQLFIDFLKREPLACIKGSRTVYIDENDVFFQLPQEAERADVPVITGAERAGYVSEYGKQSRRQEVVLAMRIIKGFKPLKEFRGVRVIRVDVAGSSNATLFLLVPAPETQYTKTAFVAPERSLQVKIGQDDIPEKMRILATLLPQVRTNIAAIEYIDLRFKEPVIKFMERSW